MDILLKIRKHGGGIFYLSHCLAGYLEQNSFQANRQLDCPILQILWILCNDFPRATVVLEGTTTAKAAKNVSTRVLQCPHPLSICQEVIFIELDKEWLCIRLKIAQDKL